MVVVVHALPEVVRLRLVAKEVAWVLVPGLIWVLRAARKAFVT